MQAAMTGVYLYDESTDMLRLASCVSENEVVDLARDERFVLWRTAAPAASVQTWRTIMRSDQYAWFTTGTDSQAGPGYLLNWHRAMGHLSLLAVPLKLGERALGFVGMFFAHERLPDEERLELARVFGQQAALADADGRPGGTRQAGRGERRASRPAGADQRGAHPHARPARDRILARHRAGRHADRHLAAPRRALRARSGCTTRTTPAGGCTWSTTAAGWRRRRSPGTRARSSPLPIDRDKPLFRRLFDGVVGIIDPVRRRRRGPAHLRAPEKPGDRGGAGDPDEGGRGPAGVVHGPAVERRRRHARADRVRPHPRAAGDPAAGGHPARRGRPAGGAQPRARADRDGEGGGTSVDQRGAATRRAAGAGAHLGHHQYPAVDHPRADARLLHRPGPQDDRRAARRRRRHLLGAQRRARHPGGAADLRERQAAARRSRRRIPRTAGSCRRVPKRRPPPAAANRWCWGRHGPRPVPEPKRFATGCATRDAAARCTCR